MLGIMHHGDATGVDVLERIDIVANQNLAGEIPVIELAVDGHFPGRRDGVDAVVVSLHGARPLPGEQDAKEAAEPNAVFHGCVSFLWFLRI